VNGYRRTAKLGFGTFAMAAAAAFLLSACSEVGYPAVHDMPAPRADATLTPDQVKQATDDLISQRQHLDTEATGQLTPVSLGPGNASSAAQQGQASAQPVAAQPAAPSGASAAPLTTGAYTKP